jgi:hypothetical protein
MNMHGKDFDIYDWLGRQNEGNGSRTGGSEWWLVLIGIYDWLGRQSEGNGSRTGGRE